MAKASGIGQALYVQGYDLSGDTNAVNNCSSPRGVVDGNGIGNAATERILTHADAQIDWVSFFNDAAGQAHVALSPLPTTDVNVAWLTDNATAGEPAAMIVAKQMNYDPTRNQDGSILFAVQALANGQTLEWGITLSAGEDTHASAASSASVDNGAGTSNGLIGMLQLREIDSGTPTFVIEESSDDGAGDAFTTVLSFTAVANGSEPTAELVTVTGAIEQYLRVTSTGTFTNADHVVIARRGTANDDVDRS